MPIAEGRFLTQADACCLNHLNWSNSAQESSMGFRGALGFASHFIFSLSNKAANYFSYILSLPQSQQAFEV